MQSLLKENVQKGKLPHLLKKELLLKPASQAQARALTGSHKEAMPDRLACSRESKATSGCHLSKRIDDHPLSYPSSEYNDSLMGALVYPGDPRAYKIPNQ